MPSAVISSISYDAATLKLRVQFTSGMIYDYLDVPEAVYIAMKTSGAKGIYLNRYIKGKYAFEKIESAT
jgi:hypothetical protein